MQKVFDILLSYLRTAGRPRRSAVLLLCLTAAFVFNYTHDFKRTVMNVGEGSWLSVGGYMLYYGVPYLISLFVWTHGQESGRRARSARVLTIVVLGLLVLALNRAAIAWTVHAVTAAVDDRAAGWYLGRIAVNATRLLALALPLLAIRRWIDVGRADFYGLTRRGFELRPYAIMLAVMVLPLAAVSFLPSFQQTYPVYRPGFVEAATGWSRWLTWPVHEMSYALRFVSVEFFFRGFLVLGLARYLGRDAIVPQVVLYAIWHFGKPMPEAVGSVFGGWILAVLALETGSIFGGILIHMGIALLMNLGAVAAAALLG